MKKTSKNPGFTLIELLVVISIIAILASIAIPAFSAAQLSANQNKALQGAKGIFYGLKLFANDHSGQFPSSVDVDYAATAAAAPPLTDANGAYRNLVPAYMSDESPFSVPLAKYCKNATGAYVPPTNQVNSVDRNQVLKQYENAWAYVSGLNDSSNASYPLIADGFSDGPGVAANCTYSKTEGAYGAVWKGRKAVVVHVGGNAQLENINQTTLMVQRPDGTGNMFTANADPNNPWIVGCTVYDPK